MSKKLATKKQVRNALYSGDKNTEIKKLQLLDASYFIRKRYFDRSMSQTYLIFQPTLSIFKVLLVLLKKFQDGNLESCRKKRVESITTSVTLDKSFTSKLTNIHNSKVTVKFERNYLKQVKVSFSQSRICRKFFIVYGLDIRSRDLHTNFTLKDTLF